MDFLGGTIFGILLGIVAAPLLASYIGWREVRDAREADLTRRILEHMEAIPRDSGD